MPPAPMALASWMRRNKATTAIVVLAPVFLVAARASSFAMAAAATAGIAPGQTIDVPQAQIDVPAAAPVQKSTSADALKAYAQGDLDLAAELAKTSGDERLAAKISDVQARAAASGVARVSGDLDNAIREL